MLTIEAAILNSGSYAYLEARASEYQRLLRQMHVTVNCQGQKAEDVVKALLRTEGWTSRQLNALRIELEGMTFAWKQLLTRRIGELTLHIKKLVGVIAKETNKHRRHQRKRKLATQQARLAKMKVQLKAGRPNFCFGGYKLFRAQFHLHENRYRDHAAWKTNWQAARSNGFTLIGKAADATGCSDCQIIVIQASSTELSAVLKLRKLNREITTKQARPCDYIIIPVTFRYNIPQILAAIASHQALSYRFFQREGKWRVHLITATAKVSTISDVTNGAIGVDLNPECIATARIKPDGNPVAFVSYDLKPRTTANQAKNELGNIVATIVQSASVARVPIVIEDLDFQQIQKELKSRGLNRRLSKFKFSLFQTMLHTRAAKAGVEVITVNPAYTSIIGFFKFGYGNGLNRHESAAIAIARRVTRPGHHHFSERLRFRTQHPEAPDPKTLRPPATDGRRHPWKGWRRLGSLLHKSTQRGKARARPCPAGGGFPKEDDLDYSPSVTTVPPGDKPELAAQNAAHQKGHQCAPQPKPVANLINPSPGLLSSR